MSISSNPGGVGKYFTVEHLRTNLKARALKGATVTVVVQGLNYGILTVGTIIQARLLTPRDFGLVTMVLSISLLLANFGANGFIEAIVQKGKLDSRQVSTLFWINIGISLLLMGLFMAMAPAIAAFYSEPLLRPIVLVMGVSILLPAFSNQHLALLRRNMEFLKASSLELTATIISLAVSILLSLDGWGYWSLVAKWIIGPLIFAVGIWLVCDWRPGPPARGCEIRSMLGFASHTYGNFITAYFRRNVDKIIIGRYLGSQLLGSYDRAYHLSNVLVNQLVSPLNAVAISSFSRIADDRQKYRHYYLAVLSMLSFISMPFSALLTITGKDVVFLLLGARWNTAGEILVAFAPSIGVGLIYITHAWLHLSLATPDRWFRWGIVAFIVSTLGLLCGLPFGILGVAVAYSTVSYLLLLPGIYYAGRPINLTVLDIIGAMIKPFTAAIASGFFCLLVVRGFEPISRHYASLGALIRIMIATGLCMVSYLAIMIVVFRSWDSLSKFLACGKEVIGISRHKNA